MDNPGITLETEPYFKNGLWGWDGSQWRKLNLLWGYHDRYAEAKQNLDANGGPTCLQFSTVPVGEVWVVTSVVWVDVDSGVATITLNLSNGSLTCVIYVENGALANVYKTVQLNVVMKAGDYLIVGFYSTTLHDSIFAWALGYKMSIVE